MKRIIACIALLIVASCTFSQQNKTAAPLTKKDLLQKSKNQKTAAWILMGGGLGLTTLGFSTESSNDNNSGNSARNFYIVSGLSAVSVSTALFIAAQRNKNKAGALSFKMEKTQYIQRASVVQRSFPALSLRFNL